jgi:hypothetical protein
MTTVYSLVGKYPVQVTKWKSSYTDLQDVIRDFGRQMVSCALFFRIHKDGMKLAVFRERFDDDPEELDDQSQTLPNEMLVELLTFKDTSTNRICDRELELIIDDVVWKTLRSCDINICDAIRITDDECRRRKTVDGRDHYPTVHLVGKWREKGDEDGTGTQGSCQR